MIETLLVIICLILLKIAYQVIDIASIVREANKDRPYDVKNRQLSVDRIVVAINKLPDQLNK